MVSGFLKALNISTYPGRTCFPIGFRQLLNQNVKILH